MPEESVKILQDAETAAAQRLEEARLQIEEKETEAKRIGEARIIEAEARARAELAELKRSVQQNAAVEAANLVSNMENKKAAIRAKAESAMDKAAAFIVERIVRDEWQA